MPFCYPTKVRECKDFGYKSCKFSGVCGKNQKACVDDYKTKFLALLTMTIKLSTFGIFSAAALALNTLKLVKTMIEVAYAAGSAIYSTFF